MIMIMSVLNNNNGSTLWGSVVIGLLAITGIGFLIRKYLRRKAMGGRYVNDHKKPEKPHNLESQLELPDGIVEKLEPNVARFAGNFGALLSISTGSDEDIALADMTFQNVADVINVRCDEQVKTWFSEFTKDRKTWDATTYRDKAALLIKIFKGCGVTTFEETVGTWSNKISVRYNRIVQIEEGASCKVVAPCWMLNGIVIEKGMVMAAK